MTSPTVGWLIWKRNRGGYYRPDACGYTTDVRQAGLFNREFAEREASNEPSNFEIRPAPTAPPPPTDAQIAELRRLAGAATAGPWTTEKLDKDADGWTQGVIVAATARGQGVYANPPGGTFPEADRRYIAAANPQAVLAVLDALQAAREALDKYGKHHQGCDMYQSFKRETGRCYCGLSDTRAALPQAAAEERGDG